MSHATDILTLGRWMAADFSNQAQAFANPPFFAHISGFIPKLFFGRVMISSGILMLCAIEQSIPL